MCSLTIECVLLLKNVGRVQVSGYIDYAPRYGEVPNKALSLSLSLSPPPPRHGQNVSLEEPETMYETDDGVSEASRKHFRMTEGIFK